MNSKSGTLYIVATPIGNLGDMTQRAVEVLKSVALILAEDTRHAGILLSRFAIDRPLWSCHEHNERQQAGSVVQRLQNGDDVALVSDAGTPLISDPGYPLVNAVVDAGFTVTPVPGACAVTAALSVSGLPTDRFIFEGFAPSKGGQRRTFLERVGQQTATVVMYESSHRILDCLEDMRALYGDERQVVVGRELTKRFERFYRGTTGAVTAEIAADEHGQRGEFVVMLAGADDSDAKLRDAERLLDLLVAEMPLKSASRIAARFTGAPRNALYDAGLSMQRDKQKNSTN